MLKKQHNTYWVSRIKLAPKKHEEIYLKTADGIKIAINHFGMEKEQVLIITNNQLQSRRIKE